MKRNSGIILSLTIIIIAFVAYVAAFGLEVGGYLVKPLGSLVKQGLDLKGGIYVVEEIQEKNVSSETVDRTIQLIKERVDKFGVVDPVIVKDGTNRISIELPGMYDQQTALNYIGKTGELKFMAPDGKTTILTGKDIKDAYVTYDSNNQPQISLEMNASGKTKFAEATQKYVGQKIAIYLDNDMLVDPTVETAITDGTAVITNMESLDEAKKVASLIKSGALPVTLKAENVRTIGPSLGSDALSKSILAGIVGISLVMIFMLLYYRLPGLVADIALTVYILLDLITFIVFNATLSLAGISGFLLSIGMAVDANVLIFERIREELKTGKTLNSALDAGFHRALSSIIDSNVTTAIAAIILAMLGSGTVKGFAVTLTIGIIVSMFTAIFVTRFLLRLVINIKPFKNPKLYNA